MSQRQALEPAGQALAGTGGQVPCDDGAVTPIRPEVRFIRPFASKPKAAPELTNLADQPYWRSLRFRFE